jgi:flavin reductase
MNWQFSLSGPGEEPQIVRASDPAQANLFRAAMRRFATTVSILTCTSEGSCFGMSATAVTSLSTEPPALLVCVNTATATHRALSRGGTFCVNVLRSCHAELSKSFSGQSRGEERFRVGAWQKTQEGLPFLADAQANLFCQIERTMTYATHTVFVARVHCAIVNQDVDPLIYQDGVYSIARPVPAQVQTTTGDGV